MEAQYESEFDPLQETGELPDLFVESETPVIEEPSLAEDAVIGLRAARARLYATQPGTIERIEAEHYLSVEEEKYELYRKAKNKEPEISESEIIYKRVTEFLGKLFKFGRS